MQQKSDSILGCRLTEDPQKYSAPKKCLTFRGHFKQDTTVLFSRQP